MIKEKCKCEMMFKKIKQIYKYGQNLIKAYSPTLIPLGIALLIWFIPEIKKILSDESTSVIFSGAFFVMFTTYMEIYKKRKENLSALISILAVFESIMIDLLSNKKKLVAEYVVEIESIPHSKNVKAKPILFAPFYTMLYEPIGCSDKLSFTSAYNGKALMSFIKADRCLLTLRETIEQRNINVNRQLGIELHEKLKEIKEMHENYKNEILCQIDEAIGHYQISFEGIIEYIEEYHLFLNNGILNSDIISSNKDSLLRKEWMPKMDKLKENWKEQFKCDK